MKLIYFRYSFFLLVFLSGCNGKKESTSRFDINAKSKETAIFNKASTRVDLENKGVGPIKTISLEEEINQDLVNQGKELYNTYCTICHKPDQAFIGPAPKGILKRRTPEWIMNMILAPEKMLRDDPLAKDLFMEFKGSPMANQGLEEHQARAILEYFRTL